MNGGKYALFRVQGRGFALAVQQLAQVLDAPRIFALPELRKPFAGVLLLGEEPVPFFDWRRPDPISAPPASTPYVVLCNTEFGMLGLPADEARQVVPLNLNDAEAAGEEPLPGAVGNCRVGEEQFAVIDLELLLTTLPGEQ